MSYVGASPIVLTVAIETFQLKKPFHISGHTMVDAVVVTVQLGRNGLVGCGEASGMYYRQNDDPASIVRQIQDVRTRIEEGIDRAELQKLLPMGGARNALDCAFWDLEAQEKAQPAWKLAGFSSVRPLLTTFTVGAGSPDVMAADARAYQQAKAIKIKLTGQPSDDDRVRAVRDARSEVWLGVDANQGFSRPFLEKLMPILIDARVKLIEQPFAVGEESLLDGFSSPIALAADESVQDASDLARVVGRFDTVNIKLDKCGGLTAGLDLAKKAASLGLNVMVGNAVGTSLAMAPGFVLGQACSVVDLDGPVFLATDRDTAAIYEDGSIFCSDKLWGGPR